jgi:hypothetical protein
MIYLPTWQEIDMFTESFKRLFLTILSVSHNEEKEFPEDSDRTIILFFPEIERAIQSSFARSKLEPEKLRQELIALYDKIVKQRRFQYFREAAKTFRTDKGVRYLSEILRHNGD